MLFTNTYNQQVTNCYRSPTKWREGNVFIRVCPSFCPQRIGESHMTMTHDALDLTVQGPEPPTPPHPTADMGIQGLPGSGPGSPRKWDLRLPRPWSWSPASDIWWPSLETCSNFVHFRTPPLPHQGWHLVALEAGTVSASRRYLLECVLVFNNFIGGSKERDC